jgi:hypothetical protein
VTDIGEDKEFEVHFSATVSGKITVWAEDEDEAKFEVEIGMNPEDVLDDATDLDIDIDVSEVKEA